MSKLERNDWIPVTVHIRDARYWEKTHIEIFCFSAIYIYCEQKSPDDLNTSI